jgi:threonine/homoserine/homoserine lactone efflux protein
MPADGDCVRLLDNAAKSIAANAMKTITHALFLGGLCAIIYGAAQVYRPIGWIVGGCILVWIGILMAKESRESR